MMAFKKGIMPWNKGLTKGIDERVKKSSEHHAHYWLGKHFSKETKQRMSDSQKGRQPSEETRKRLSESKQGKHNPFYGKHLSEEHKKKLSNIHLKNPSRYWLGKKMKEETKKRMSITHQTPELREIHRNVRLHQVIPFRDTAIERKVQDELAIREIGFYKHFPVIGQPDIAFPDKKIAVFCDGDYWHTTERGLKRDAEVNEVLRNEGWLVLRYWEHEINDNIEGCIDEIEDIILRR